MPADKAVNIVGIKIDVSERKIAGEKIREQAELLDKAHDAIIVCTLNHQITFWNQGAHRIYGWTAEEAVGQRNIRQLLCSAAPRFRAQFHRRVGKSARCRTRRMDGRSAAILPQAGTPVIRCSIPLYRRPGRSQRL